MIAAEVMVPCFSNLNVCRPDWAAISALGGWVAAVVTFLAVLLPFRQYTREKREMAQDAYDEAKIQLGTLLPTLAMVYVTARFIPDQLDGRTTRDSAMTSYREWIGFMRNVAIPNLPRHRQLVRERSAVAIFATTISNFKIYDSAVLSDATVANLKESIHIIDNASNALAQMIHKLHPELKANENFPDYFSGPSIR